MERNIHDWLVINDPTLVILPNSKYNYSRILNGKYKFKLINRQPSLLSFNRQIKPLKIDKIFLPYRSLENNYSIYNLYTYPALPEVSFELPKLKLEYPLFRDYYSGETIPLKFPASMEMKHIIKKYPPQSSTLIQVKCTENPDFFPDVKILKSSGSINLDNMARNTIITQSSFIDSKYFSPNKYLKIEVVWQKESL
ncbi:MAG: hypothetical protein K9M56_01125 [Victivallales bacterium]|nr:hypothetical protein [Victivallales bacterium]